MALGGRGGKEPGVILDLGYFLAKSGFVDISSLLERKSFDSQDPSFFYPLSGLYNSFLLKELGLDRCLALYLKYSGTAEAVSVMKVRESDLPGRERWQDFLDKYKQYENVYFAAPPRLTEPVWQGGGGSIYRAGESYFFRIKAPLLLGRESEGAGSSSALFSELLPESDYRGEKYLITANSAEAGVYNLLTGNLEANHVCGFSFDAESVPASGEFFEFFVRKKLFDRPLEGMMIRCLDTD